MKQKMIVMDKRDLNRYTVYDIQYDSAGYPHFLIFKDGEWLRQSAKHYVPTVAEVSPLMISYAKYCAENKVV